MSQPTRYIFKAVVAHGEPALLMQITEGKNSFVSYSNYAALAAENERLRSASFVTAVPSEEYERLKAENKRLRKAGDKMDAYLKRQDGTTNGMLECRRAWLEAKEGGAK